MEIGGSFRIPDIMTQCGCALREVGTTNKTHLFDYENAIGPETRALLRVHTSNFRIVGFCERPGLAELVELGKLTRRAWDAGVQVMVEGPGHMALDEIAANILDKSLVEDAKYGHPCTAQELAFRAMKMQAAQGTSHMADVTADFQASGIAQVQTPAAPAQETDPDSPEAIEAQAKADVAAWQKMMEVC